jgi:hypothetical protein
MDSVYYNIRLSNYKPDDPGCVKQKIGEGNQNLNEEIFPHPKGKTGIYFYSDPVWGPRIVR